MKKYNQILLPVRIQPPHIGHIKLIKYACNIAENVLIIICEARKQDINNPFTSQDRELMLRYSLEKENIKNFKIKHFKCFGENSLNNAIKEFNLDSKTTTVLSGNPWVIENFKKKGFEIIKNHFEIKFSSKKIRDSFLNDNLGWQFIAATGTIYLEKELDLKNKIKKFKENE